MKKAKKGARVTLGRTLSSAQNLEDKGGPEIVRDVPEAKWLDLLKEEGRDIVPLQIVHDIMSAVDRKIYKIYLQKQAISFTVHCYHLALRKLFEMRQIQHDVGEADSYTSTWLPSEEPKSLSLDSFARGVLPCPSRIPSARDLLEQEDLLWSAAHKPQHDTPSSVSLTRRTDKSKSVIIIRPPPTTPMWNSEIDVSKSFQILMDLQAGDSQLVMANGNKTQSKDVNSTAARRQSVDDESLKSQKSHPSSLLSQSISEILSTRKSSKQSSTKTAASRAVKTRVDETTISRPVAPPEPRGRAVPTLSVMKFTPYKIPSERVDVRLRVLSSDETTLILDLKQMEQMKKDNFKKNITASKLKKR